jgi:hypothetical protein
LIPGGPFGRVVRSTVAFGTACLALAASVVFSDVRIRFGELMAIDAVGRFAFRLVQIASSDVLAVGYWFKVGARTAECASTQMI